LAESGARVEVQETFDSGDTRMQCVLDADGYLAILSKSCLFQGTEYNVHERYNDDKIWYTCKKDGPGVRTGAIGCVDDGRTMAFKETTTKDDLVYTCKKGGRGAELHITGCYKDDRKLAFGETYESEALWYTCTQKGFVISGCYHGGQRFMDGDQVHDNDALLKCKVDGELTALVPDGCIQHDENGVETLKKFGCYWTEGTEPYKYEMTCKLDSDRNTAVKVQIRCHYKGPDGAFSVEAGCYERGNGISVGCIKDDSTGRLETRIFNEKPDPSTGLRQC